SPVLVGSLSRTRSSVPSRPPARLSSCLRLLSPNQQLFLFLDPHREYTDRVLLLIDLIENAEAVVRPEAQFPFSARDHWPLQRLAVAGFHVRFEEQLGLNLRPDQGMILGFDGLQMLLDLFGVEQSEWLFLRHCTQGPAWIPGNAVLQPVSSRRSPRWASSAVNSGAKRARKAPRRSGSIGRSAAPSPADN